MKPRLTPPEKLARELFRIAARRIGLVIRWKDQCDKAHWLVLASYVLEKFERKKK